MLKEARHQLDAAGDDAAGKIRTATDSAPSAPKDKGPLDFLESVGGGMWDSLKSYGELAAKFDPNRLSRDPLGYLGDVKDLGEGLVGAAQDPVEFGKALVDWDTWANDPGRAIGSLIPDAAIGVATGGTGAVAKRTGTKIVEEAAEHAPDGGGHTPDSKPETKLEPGMDRGDGRDILGHYVGADTTAKAKEIAKLDEIAATNPDKYIATEQRKATLSDGTGHRKFDGILFDADAVPDADGIIDGHALEIKSGDASLTPNQRAFDPQVTPETPAYVKVKNQDGVEVTVRLLGVIYERVP